MEAAGGQTCLKRGGHRFVVAHRPYYWPKVVRPARSAANAVQEAARLLGLAISRMTVSGMNVCPR
jgi:hypothetical protein